MRFQPPLGETLHLGRTNAFFLGGGKALANAYYRAAEATAILEAAAKARKDSESV